MVTDRSSPWGIDGDSSVAGNCAGNLIVDGLTASGTNTERITQAPVAGNNATGLRLEQSSRDVAIIGTSSVEFRTTLVSSTTIANNTLLGRSDPGHRRGRAPG